jgi:Zn-finger nucleic acid-binding protein
MPRCPVCFLPLTRVEEDGIKRAVCSQCRGTWIERGALMRRTQLDVKEKAASDGHEQLGIFARSIAELLACINSREDELRCFSCEKPLSKEKFHPMIAVSVDRCPRCFHLWLDEGEFILVRRLYAELITSTDPEVTRRRDKVGAVAAEWLNRQQEVQAAKETLEQLNTGRVDIGGGGFDLLQYLIKPR